MEYLVVYGMCSMSAVIGFIAGALLAGHKHAEECHRCILLRRRIA